VEHYSNIFLGFGSYFDPESVYVCVNCGRRSLDRSGHFELTSGWNQSCAKAAIRLPASSLKLDERGLVVAINREIILKVQKGLQN
jgi:hypothetical protein